MHEDGRASFEAWARARQQGLVRSAYLLTGDFQRAEDLVQDALIKAATRWDTLRHGNPDAWVRTVVYRDHVSWWRRHRRETVIEHAPESVPAAAGGEGAVMLRAALGRLTQRQRAVVLLRYVEDLTARQAAEVLGVTVGTVKKQTSIALARLRETAPELEELVEERR
jgi:RNA polymerase sigma-70 factor (sigma-E family)